MKSGIKLIHGIGINDADYSVAIEGLVDGKKKIIWKCPFYQTWSNMLARCYSSVENKRHKTYIGCTAHKTWHRFSIFKEWMETQPWAGNELDKDILVQGNKKYGPEYCVFVSTQLNTFIVDRAAARGDSPLGVHWHKQSGKYRAQCKNPFTGKVESLGLFSDKDKAHQAWRSRKHHLACIYADMQTDQRIADALRSRYSD